MCGLIVVEGNIDLTFEKYYNKIIHRGPDDHKIVHFEKGIIGFHRLSIMGLSATGSQPFKSLNQNLLVCNGEIYNYKKLKGECSSHQFLSGSDCEVLLPLYERYGIEEMVKKLDGEYALVIWDFKKEKLLAARDAMGIRPLFYGKTKENKISFASEAKALIGFCHEIKAFPPGHYYDGEQIISYLDLSFVKKYHEESLSKILTGINIRLRKAVEKRLQSDAEIGFLLSGGLDSSLVVALAQKMSKKPIKTFSIGMITDAIDSKYAKDVADYVGTDHTNVTMTKEDILDSLRDVIYHLESWDITTVRASIGMFLICKFIKEKTKIKVLITGEVSDELFGYKYTDFAPSAEEFQKEAQKRIRELYLYDVLRADRCISAHSLEARVPFSDNDFVQYVMGINPKLKLNNYKMGKFLLREAFNKKEKLLPEHILWREKAAFSDAVGHSMVDELKNYSENKYTDLDLKNAYLKYPYKTPFTKESLLYREIFEEFYPGNAELIKDFWMPNQEWEGCKVSDPSARALANYGASGA